MGKDLKEELMKKVQEEEDKRSYKLDKQMLQGVKERLYELIVTEDLCSPEDIPELVKSFLEVYRSR